MNEQQQIEQRLWDHIDGLGNVEERSAIEDLIAHHREWQLKYRELLGIQQAMSSEELEVPSLRFSKNVMEEIAKHRIAPATNSYFSKKVIRGIAAFFLVSIGGALIYTFTLLKGLGSHRSPGPSLYEPVWQGPLDKFNWGKIFNSPYLNVFLMVNLVLGLMLLDMYLGRKKRQAGSH
jgi:hypothetical protein